MKNLWNDLDEQKTKWTDHKQNNRRELKRSSEKKQKTKNKKLSTHMEKKNLEYNG